MVCRTGARRCYRDRMSDSAVAPPGHSRRPSLGRVSTAQAVVNALVTEILDGTLTAGTQLREVELADRFGVSRQSLRAALADIAFRGLVEREPHRSVRVASISRADAREIYALRQMIEGEAVGWLATHPETWPAVDAAVDRLVRMPRKASWSEIAEGDVAFHQATVEAVGSRRLTRLHSQLIDEMRLILVPARHYVSQKDMADEHKALFDVVKEGDPAAAVARLREHLEFGTDKLMSYLPEPD